MDLIKPSFILIALLLGIFSCGTKHEKMNPIHNDSPDIPIQQIYSLQTVKSSAGWGYQVYKNEQLFINQPHIPSIQGVKGFKSKEDAQKTGEFIIRKLTQGIMPPSVTEIELDSLGVL